MGTNGKIYVVQSVFGGIWWAGQCPGDWQETKTLSKATLYNWADAIQQMEWLNSEPNAMQRWTVRVTK